ncbi:MAG: hypothetical protein ACE5G1_04360 [bacterium]
MSFKGNDSVLEFQEVQALRRFLQIVGWLLLGSLVFENQPVLAGAWPQKKGGLYFKLSTSYLYTTKEFNHTGDKLDIFQERLVYNKAAFRDFGIAVYLEYGLSHNFTLVSSVPFKILTSRRTESIGGGTLFRIVKLHTTGLSDFSILGRYSILNGGLALSLQGGFKLPLGYDSNPADDGAPLGTGKVDYELNLLVGKSLYPAPAYLTGGVGYRRRTGALSDQILISAEVGVTAGKFLLKTTFDGLRSTKAPPDIVGQPVVSPLPGGGGALPNIIVGDQDIFKISPSVIYKLAGNFSVQGEVLHIVAGKNTVAGTIISLGFILEK